MYCCEDKKVKKYSGNSERQSSTVSEDTGEPEQETINISELEAFSKEKWRQFADYKKH